jgi:hypothetical protein
MKFSFANARPSKKTNFVAKGYDNSVYRDFDVDPKKAPYRLDIQKVLGTDLSKTKMVFHTVGDTGGVKNPVPQQIVANKMEEQFLPTAKPQDQPLFFYHLGDVVYYYGEESNYNSQFFEPYIHYPVPILAIAGNHDGDLDPTNQTPPKTLEAFNKVFCSDAPVHLPIAGESSRTTMIQPNVYWTLQTPLANIIGLYCNDTQHGTIKEPQIEWFKKELKNAKSEQKTKAIIVALHYPVFSVDSDHGSSGEMKKVLDDAFTATGVYPDLILTGHVHNYQRFTRKMDNGNEIPYIVAGAGGYWNLHKVETKAKPVYVPNDSFFDNVVMENFCDDRHGFLRITIENTNTERTITGEYFTVPRPQESWSAAAELFDYFTIDLKSHTVKNIKSK